MMRLILLLALLSSPVAAQELSFTTDATESCLSNNGHSGDDRTCIGLSAAECMGQPDGSTTVGMGFCLDSELSYWDKMLNGAYQQLMQARKVSDAELPSNLAIQASTLRDMQRAWIRYRDARCNHEASLWQGGTGANPAFLQCLMIETAEQALYLSALYSGEG